MSLSEATILELKDILAEEFDYDCSKEEASEIATSLVQLVETLKEIDREQYGGTTNQQGGTGGGASDSDNRQVSGIAYGKRIRESGASSSGAA
jgi:hypothetical protein